MKKIILLLTIGVALTTQTLLAQVPSYVPSNGLVGYWPFNGNANDQSGNNLNGTVTGATLTMDRFGNTNSAYNFNGISNKIEVNDNSQLQLTTFTVSLWVNATSGYSLVNKSNWSDGSLETFNIGLGTNLLNSSIKMNSNCFAGQGWNNITTNTGSLYNSWKHVVVVFNGSNVKHFINGVQVNSQPLVGLMDTCFGGKLKFGAWWQSSPDYLNGKLDDIGIWNRALTQQEITAMYNGVTYSDTCNAVSGSLTQGLVGYWPFCGNANDDSGNGNNGTVNGATLTTDRFGNTNSAYNFDGQNDYISCNPLTGIQQVTVSVWFKKSGLGGHLVSQNDWTTAENVSFGSAYEKISNNFTVGVNSGNCNFQGSQSFANIFYNLDSNWHHRVTTINNLGLIRDFLDGQLINSSTISNFQWCNSTSAILKFGAWWNSDMQSWDGKIDDIGIWNRILTAQEITQLYNQNQCITNITVTDTLIINVGQLSYTNPVAYANNITIYPNPASTQININFNNITNLVGGSVKVINSLGQQVATTPITTTGTNSTMLLSTWGGSGLYFVQILNPQGQIVDIKKILLQ
jgi:Concanavalin A-like lectin/glucanases superfamily/Secretion system C-terminal sorting domain